MSKASDPSNSTYSALVTLNANDNFSLLNQLADEYDPNKFVFFVPKLLVTARIDAGLVKP
jgi:hypothetical protein